MSGAVIMEDWNKEKNLLTWELFKKGYTKDNHPSYVKWIDYKHEFTYTSDYMKESIWEAPCGLLKKGFENHSEMGYMGISWRPENNNPTTRCPFDKAGCELNHEYLRGSLLGEMVECALKLSNKPYDYEKSFEKQWDEYDENQRKLKTEFLQSIGANAQVHCDCIHWDYKNKKWYSKYDPERCARDCYNNTKCVLTGRTIDLSKKGNVFYDVKTTKICQDGSIFDGEPIMTIIKGKKYFSSPVKLAICEEFARLCKGEIMFREKSNRSLDFFRDKTYSIEILNVRAERRESRDLTQDLADIKSGIKILHESDRIIASKEAKKQRKQKYQKKKAEKAGKLRVKTIEKYEQITIF